MRVRWPHPSRQATPANFLRGSGGVGCADADLLRLRQQELRSRCLTAARMHRTWTAPAPPQRRRSRLQQERAPHRSGGRGMSNEEKFLDYQQDHNGRPTRATPRAARAQLLALGGAAGTPPRHVRQRVDASARQDRAPALLRGRVLTGGSSSSTSRSGSGSATCASVVTVRVAVGRQRRWPATK